MTLLLIRESVKVTRVTKLTQLTRAARLASQTLPEHRALLGHGEGAHRVEEEHREDLRGQPLLLMSFKMT